MLKSERSKDGSSWSTILGPRVLLNTAGESQAPHDRGA